MAATMAYSIWHIPKLKVKSELQLPADTTATATPDLSCFCKLRQSWQQHGILNPVIGARHRTSILMDTMSGS